MPGDVEFLDDDRPAPATGPDAADGPSTGGPRAGARLWLIGAAVAATFLGIAAITQRAHDAPTSSPAPTSGTTSTPEFRVVAATSPNDEVLALADSGPLHDQVRQTSPAGQCRPVRVGTSPLRRIESVLATLDPAARVRDSRRVLDQFTGLCSIEVRTRALHGVVVTVRITPPTRGRPASTLDQLQTGIVTRGSTTTEFASDVTHDGWAVLTGATGPAAQLPASRDLLTLAQDHRLRW